jgi:hypothetical protein
MFIAWGEINAIKENKETVLATSKDVNKNENAEKREYTSMYQQI